MECRQIAAAAASALPRQEHADGRGFKGFSAQDEDIEARLIPMGGEVGDRS